MFRFFVPHIHSPLVLPTSLILVRFRWMKFKKWVYLTITIHNISINIMVPTVHLHPPVVVHHPFRWCPHCFTGCPAGSSTHSKRARSWSNMIKPCQMVVGLQWIPNKKNKSVVVWAGNHPLLVLLKTILTHSQMKRRDTWHRDGMRWSSTEFCYVDLAPIPKWCRPHIRFY